MDALSVPETYFWREIDQVQAVASHLIPALLARTPAAPLRIWSVPCATGEEPLTIAMVLEEAGLFRARRDRDPRQRREPGGDREGAGGPLPRARLPQPSGRAARQYFSRDGDVWAVSPALQRRVTSWSVVNVLCEGDVAVQARAPIVFCRNVFIYFSQARDRPRCRAVRPRHAVPRVPVSGRIRVAAPDADAVRARRDRRRIHLREAVRRQVVKGMDA